MNKPLILRFKFQHLALIQNLAETEKKNTKIVWHMLRLISPVKRLSNHSSAHLHLQHLHNKGGVQYEPNKTS